MAKARIEYLDQLLKTGICPINSPDVVAYGLSKKEVNSRFTDDIALVFYVNEKKPISDLDTKQRIPEQLEIVNPDMNNDVLTVLTDVRAADFFVTDTCNDYLEESPHRTRHRPVPGGGISIGHPNVRGGTSGGLFISKEFGRVILSCNHILADHNRASLGDKIIQPGQRDGGSLTKDAVCELVDFIELQFHEGEPPEPPLNYIDCAIARPLPGVQIDWDMIGIGPDIPSKTRELNIEDVGLSVTKCGRTTGKTMGVIQSIQTNIPSIDFKVGDEFIGTVGFRDQIIIKWLDEVFSASGDSGSLLLTEEGNDVIGLLFATHEEAKVTACSPISNVMEALQLSYLHE